VAVPAVMLPGRSLPAVDHICDLLAERAFHLFPQLLPDPAVGGEKHVRGHDDQTGVAEGVDVIDSTPVTVSIPAITSAG
jgi:hypothetical protein